MKRRLTRIEMSRIFNILKSNVSLIVTSCRRREVILTRNESGNYKVSNI